MSTHPSIRKVLIAPPSPQRPVVPRLGLLAAIRPNPLTCSWSGIFITQETIPTTNLWYSFCFWWGHVIWALSEMSLLKGEILIWQKGASSYSSSQSIVTHTAQDSYFLSRPDRGLTQNVPREIHIKLQTHKHYLLAAHHNNVRLSQSQQYPNTLTARLSGIRTLQVLSQE